MFFFGDWCYVNKGKVCFPEKNTGKSYHIILTVLCRLKEHQKTINSMLNIHRKKTLNR